MQHLFSGEVLEEWMKHRHAPPPSYSADEDWDLMIGCGSSQLIGLIFDLVASDPTGGK
tara:strand:- start:189 stop:362 length:174 start_codon:yes stop_codon:yes gene_type:complete